MPRQTFFNLPEEKRGKIVEVALEEFAAKDYHDVYVTTIVERADIAKGSFYQYFEDKEDLFGYLIELAQQKKLDFIGSRVSLDVSVNDFFTIWKNMILAGWQFALENPVYWQFGRRMLESPVKDLMIEEVKKRTTAFIRDLVEKARVSGQLREDVSVDLMVCVLSAAAFDFATHIVEKAGISLPCEQDEVKRREMNLNLPRMADEFIRLLESGFKRQKEGVC